MRGKSGGFICKVVKRLTVDKLVCAFYVVVFNIKLNSFKMFCILFSRRTNKYLVKSKKGILTELWRISVTCILVFQPNLFIYLFIYL